MNRCFFADEDPEAKMRLTEVELLRSFMEENFSKKVPEKKEYATNPNVPMFT